MACATELEPNRIVALWSVPPGHPDQMNPVSVPDYIAWTRRATSFDAIGAMNPSSHDFGAEQDGTPAERIQGEDYTADMFQALGVRPFMGRVFTADEAGVDHPAPVLLISHRLWIRRFNADKDILTRTVLVDGAQTQIIGVLPPGFRFCCSSSREP
jgi:putative ABC transport system permease protein